MGGLRTKGRSEYISFLQSLLSPIFLKYNSQGWNIGDKGDRFAFPESICPLHYIVRLARYREALMSAAGFRLLLSKLDFTGSSWGGIIDKLRDIILRSLFSCAVP